LSIQIHKKKVYLSGPISHLTFSEAKLVRSDFLEISRSVLGTLHDSICYVDPLRGKDLDPNEILTPSIPTTAQKISNKYIFNRDYFDVHHADALLVNLLGAKKVSIGTVFEMAWAYEKRIPTVVVIEGESNPHYHTFVLEAAQFPVKTLHAAAVALGHLLFPQLDVDDSIVVAEEPR
jgi:hypothetical protein